MKYESLVGPGYHTLVYAWETLQEHTAQAVSQYYPVTGTTPPPSRFCIISLFYEADNMTDSINPERLP
jgi:hypothetical protein